jgi:hypothetical protein
MKIKAHLVLSLTLCALIAAVAAPAAHAVWPQDHLDQAYDWILDPFVNPANNVWGDGASITVDTDGTVHASTKCGTFTSLLLKESYPAITDQVLKGPHGLDLAVRRRLLQRHSEPESLWRDPVQQARHRGGYPGG